MPTEPTAPETIARQLHGFKLLAAGLALALAAAAGAFLFVRHLGQPVTIFLDGRAVATVHSAAAANADVAAAERAKVGAAFTADPICLQKITLVTAAPGAPQDTDAAAQAKLSHRLRLRVPAYAVLVGNRPSLAFPSPEKAAATLDLVKAHWAQMPPAAPLVGDAEIIQKMSVEKRTVDTALLRSDPEAAAPYYWTPPPSRTYTIRAGDLGSRVALRNHLTLAEFIRANPGRNLNRLKPGDTVNVQKLPLLLTVRVRKRLEVTEKVHPSAPAYAAGLQQVSYLVTYWNGVEQSREAQNVVILQKPRTALSL